MDERNELQRDETLALRRRMTRGTATFALQRVVEATVSFLLVPYMLHMLGGAAYGYWALIYAVVSYLNLSDMGFSAALNYHFVHILANGDRERRREYFSSAFFYLFAIAAAVMLIGLAVEPLLLDFFPGSRDLGMAANWAWRGMLFVLCMGFLTGYGRSLFYSTHRVALLGVVNTTFSLVYGAAVFIALAAGGGLTGLAAASVLVSLLRFATVFGVGARGVPDFGLASRSVKKTVIRTFWAFGLRIMAARIAEVIYSTFDRLLLGRTLGLSVVAWYDIGAKAAGVAQQAPLVVLPVVEPEAARFHAHGEQQKLHLLVERSARYAALVGIPLVVLLIVAGKALLRLWLGTDVNPNTVSALSFLVAAYVGMALTAPLRSVARGIGHPGWEAKAATLQAVANMILSILLYLVFGFKGVLIGTLCALLLGQGWLILLVLPGLKLNVLEFVRASWLRPLIASLFAGLLSWVLLRWGVMLPEHGGRVSALMPAFSSTGLFVVAYVLIALGLKATSVNEIQMITRSLRGKA